MELVEEWKDLLANENATLTDEEKSIIDMFSPDPKITKDFFFEYSTYTYNRLDESFGYLSGIKKLSDIDSAKILAIDILMRRLYPSKTDHYNNLMKSGIDSFQELLKLKKGGTH